MTSDIEAELYETERRFLVEDRSILDGKCGGAGGWRA